MVVNQNYSNNTGTKVGFEKILGFKVEDFGVKIWFSKMLTVCVLTLT